MLVKNSHILLALLGCFCISIVKVQAQTKTQTKIDTIVIRAFQQKAVPVNSKAKIKDTLIPINEAKTLKKRINSFKMPSFWAKKNKFGLNFSEVAFVNWNAGGNNSIAGIASAYFERNYKFKYVQWDNSLDLRYGLNAEEGNKIRKTDDQIRFVSTFGYRSDTISKWYYSGKLNFNTQFDNGYKYPDRENAKSRFMAPGYLFLGVGTSYIDQPKKVNIYISPLTMKATFVLDQVLADRGAFGVKKAIYDESGNIVQEGERIFMELGFLFTHKYEKQLMDNVLMKSNLSLYTDYVASFGNVDVDWALDFKLKVNEYITSSIGTHLLYDDDIKFQEEVTVNGVSTIKSSPKIQFKQILGIGVVYAF
jgi:hypothetical protein